VLGTGGVSSGHVRLRQAQSEEALREGAFGVPTLVVVGHPGLPPGRRMFFGCDRFEQMAALLGKPWMGPCPPVARL
jgi:2-hydroxychromene-2-carboxylate isomerase